jgi:hypothetical protein
MTDNTVEFVPRGIHECSKFLQNLHGVEPGTFPIVDLLELRPELGSLKWDLQSREIDSSKKLKWLRYDWRFVYEDMTLEEVKDVREQFETSEESCSGTAVIKRAFEILEASLDSFDGPLREWSMGVCDTVNHLEIAFELAEYLMLPVNVQHYLHNTLMYCLDPYHRPNQWWDEHGNEERPHLF